MVLGFVMHDQKPGMRQRLSTRAQQLHMPAGGRKAVCAILLAAAFLWALPYATVRAQGFTIADGVIVNGTQILAAGETGIVEAGGTIDNSGGVIGSFGIFGGDNVTVNNSGRIISGSGGVFALTNATIINSGAITSRFTTITTANNATIINSGLISSSEFDGIDMNTGIIINSGTIIGGSGLGDDAIEIDGGAIGETPIINSGSILAGAGPSGSAIRFSPLDNDILTLLPGSIIVGTIDFNAGSSTLNVGPGLSIAKTFIGSPPEVINTNGAPFAVNGLQVAVVDPTSLAAQDEILSDLTSGIFNSVHARLNGSGGGAVTNGAARFGLGGRSLSQLGGGRLNLGTNDMSPVTTANNNRFELWAQAFGGIRTKGAKGPTTSSDHKLAGGIVGVDGAVSRNVRLGVFAGGAHANFETSSDTQELDTDSFFGGGYISVRQKTWFAHVMLTAGRNDYDSSRQIANNTVVGGLETASADFAGTFISPELTVGTTLRLGGFVIEPSARLRYAYLSIDGYRETGSVGALTVTNQDIALWQGRAQVALPFVSKAGRFAPRIGVEAWSSDNDNVSGVLLGQAITFDPGGDDDDVTGFVGLTATTRLSVGAHAFIDGEVHAGNDGFERSEARAGIVVRF